MTGKHPIWAHFCAAQCLAMALCAPAQAQTSDFYGRTGRYLGSALHLEDGTWYYDRRGHYVGQETWAISPEPRQGPSLDALERLLKRIEPRVAKSLISCKRISPTVTDCRTEESSK